MAHKLSCQRIGSGDLESIGDNLPSKLTTTYSYCEQESKLRIDMQWKYSMLLLVSLLVLLIEPSTLNAHYETDKPLIN